MNYSYKCQTCDSITVDNYKMAERPEHIECACGGIAKFIITAVGIMTHSYADGVKRRGFQDLKEASKLNMAAAGTDDLKKKAEIRAEISKLNVKLEK